MMKPIFSALLAASLLGACSTPQPEHFYTLSGGAVIGLHKLDKTDAGHRADFRPAGAGLLLGVGDGLGNRRRERRQQDRETGDPGGAAACQCMHSHGRILPAAGGSG